MPRYIVRAAHRETGAEVEIPVDAMTPALAQQFVNGLGLLAGSVRAEQIPPATSPADASADAENIEASGSCESQAMPATLRSAGDGSLAVESGPTGDTHVNKNPRRSSDDNLLAALGWFGTLIAVGLVSGLAGAFLQSLVFPDDSGQYGIPPSHYVVTLIAVGIGCGFVVWVAVRWYRRSAAACPRCGKRALAFVETSVLKQAAGAQLVSQTEYVRSEIRRPGSWGLPDYVVTTPSERTVVQSVVRRLERDRFRCKACGADCQYDEVRDYT